MLNNFYSSWLDISTYAYLNISLCLQSNVKGKAEIDIENKKYIFMYALSTIIFSHAIYKKCLNKYLRKVGFSFLRRKYLSDVIWNLGFTSLSIFYIILCDHLFRPEIYIIILKSFYLHYCGVQIFMNEKLKGFMNFLFAISIFRIIFQQSFQPSISCIFLLKSIETLVLDICQLTYLIKVKQVYSKSLCIMYFFIWFYLHVVYVPTNLQIFNKDTYNLLNVNKNLILFIWIAVEYFDFIWLGIIVNFKSPNFIKSCLFRTRCCSVESQYLINKLNSYQKANKIKDKDTVKKELWQSLYCAMVLKKKLRKKLRQSKQLNQENSVDQESTTNKKTV